MNQIGKNLVLSLCIVATLLVILGLKRKYGGDGEAALLSQPSADIEMDSPTAARNSPRPRVLQAKAVTQHDDRAILSPTGQQYLHPEFEPSRASGLPIAPIPTANPNQSGSPRPLDAPELVPVGAADTSPRTDAADDEGPQATPTLEAPTIPMVTRPLPNFVLSGADDSFWLISERVYGSGAYYRALFRHNEANVLRPDQLRSGVEVMTPPLEVLRERYPADFPGDPAFTP